MAAVQVAQRMTPDEFLALPEREGAARTELVEGEVVVSEATARHNVVQGALYMALGNWIAAGPGRGRGQVFIPLDVRLDGRNVYAPDVSWYSAANPVDVRSQPPYPVPDLAVEVRSPSTWRDDVGAKKAGYERHGLGELWLVDVAAAEVLAFRRSRPGAPRFDVALGLGRGEALASPLLPGFGVELEALFATG